MTDTTISIERQLLRNLSRALDDEISPKAEKDLKVEIARDALRAFYRPRGLYPSDVAEVLIFDDRQQKLVAFDPKAKVKQDQWGYQG